MALPAEDDHPDAALPAVAAVEDEVCFFVLVGWMDGWMLSDCCCCFRIAAAAAPNQCRATIIMQVVEVAAMVDAAVVVDAVDEVVAPVVDAVRRRNHHGPSFLFLIQTRSPTVHYSDHRQWRCCATLGRGIR